MKRWWNLRPRVVFTTISMFAFNFISFMQFFRVVQCYLFYIRLKKRHGRELFCCSIIKTRFIFICCTCDIINHDICSRHHEVLLLDACVHYSKQFLVDWACVVCTIVKSVEIKKWKGSVLSRSVIYVFMSLLFRRSRSRERRRSRSRERRRSGSRTRARRSRSGSPSKSRREEKWGLYIFKNIKTDSDGNTWNHWV